jgi:N-dimethylarginine dimethylaminohydrolase
MPKTPSTFGGPGLRPRSGTLAGDISAGRWADCGCASETGRLRAVMLATPGEEHEHITDPDAVLMLEAPDAALLHRQAETVAHFFARRGITVYRTRPRGAASPNFLFMRDLFFMTPEGAVVARMGAEQRAGEERHASAALAAAGVPILHTMRGAATFEGADALWLRPDLVVVGTGMRTNAEGAAQLRAVLASQAVDLRVVDMPGHTQHLQGVVSFLGPELAVVHGGKLTPELAAVLEASGHELLVLDPSEELGAGRAMNIVTLGPRSILMPAGCPQTQATYEAHGVEVHTIDVSEYIKAAGALGCLTGIIAREDVESASDPS